MRKLIIQSNEWYDNLPEPKRSLFFLIVIFGSLVVAEYFSIIKGFIWAFPIWAVIFSLWRLTYIFSQIKNDKK